MTVSKELIENIKYLKKAINEVSVYDLNTYSTMELYYNIANKLNEVIKELSRFEGVVSDEVVEQNEKLLYLLGEGLTTEVIKKINQMVTDGTLDTIINNNVFNGLNNKIDTFKQEVNEQFNTIANIILKPNNIDDTENLKNAINIISENGGGKIYLSNGVFKLSDIDIIGKTNIIIEGQSYNTILDFSLSTNYGLNISYDVLNGGSKNITFENLTICDSRQSSPLIKLINIKSGITNQTPSQTVSNINFYNVEISKFNNNNAVCLAIDGVSGMTFKKVNWGFHLGCNTGLLITNTNDINTGVIDFIGCSIWGKKTAVHIKSIAQLIDTISFYDTSMFNHENDLAEETIIIEGSQISNINFNTIHLENRHNTMKQAIMLSGNLMAITFDGLHASCGNTTNQCLYAIKITNGLKRGITFSGLEIFRTKTRTNGGRHIYIDNTVTTSETSPIVILNSVDNSSTTQILEIQDNKEDIIKNVVSPSNIYSVTGKDYIYTISSSEDNQNISYGDKFIVDVNAVFTKFIGYKGQQITLTAKQEFTLQSNYTNIRLNDGKDVIIQPEESITLLNRGDVWIEVSRSVNSCYGGNFILTSPTQTITNTSCKATSTIVISPLSKSATQLQMSTKAIYTKSIENGQFTVETNDLGSPVGSEKFTYIIYNE